MDAGNWPQFLIAFADQTTAEQVAVNHLRGALMSAQSDALVTSWWFIRKAPHWRLRYLESCAHATPRLAGVLDELVSRGLIIRWTTGIYEPEMYAFGGSVAMDVAHELFHTDSQRILDYLTHLATTETGTPVLGRRELAIVLYSALMRGAGQDWYEQGDIWDKVTRLRPQYPAFSPERHDVLRAAVHRLMTVDASPFTARSKSSPLTHIADWNAAFEDAGQQLTRLSQLGALERGLRAVLTHHVIFGWNRLGLAHNDQSILANLAREVVMGEHGPAVSASLPALVSTNVPQVETQTPEQTGASIAEQLRNELVDRLHEVRTPHVEAALRAVPRHVFVPAIPVEQAYADTMVYTKQDDAGVSISAASQPGVVAMMLEQAEVTPGQNILELGAGTGYNAGLLARIAGKRGRVTTMDVDQDIVDGARRGLAAAGFSDVEVVLGDGALGHPGRAPYDRIIATVGAHGIPPAWLDQLAPGGRLVVPVRVRGSVSRSISFERDSDGRWGSLDSHMCSFMPLRAGIADDPRDVVVLSPEGDVTLNLNADQVVDPAALSGVFVQPRTEEWTGVTFRGPESMEWLWLWLTCAMDNALSRMPVEHSAVERGVVAPQFGWGAMAIPGNRGDLAYLTGRRIEDGPEHGGLYEVGVIAHGHNPEELAAEVVEKIRLWDRNFRSRSVHFEIRSVTAQKPADLPPGQFVVNTPLNQLVVTWQ